MGRTSLPKRPSPRGHTYHRSDTRRHPKGRPAYIEEEENEEVVEVLDSKDEFEVFNQALSPKTSTFNLGHPSIDLGHPFILIFDEMGIQCKPRSILLDLIES